MEGHHLPARPLDPMFWFLLITHIALLKIHADGIAEGGEGLPPLDWNASTVAMGLLTFFVVFSRQPLLSALFTSTATASASRAR